MTKTEIEIASTSRERIARTVVRKGRIESLLMEWVTFLLSSPGVLAASSALLLVNYERASAIFQCMNAFLRE